LQVIGEVSDGLEAVQKALELQPDLILLDIGLPTLNGIEAARRIRSLAPKSKVLFLSENYSADIARGALSTGGCGFVIKSDAGIELLAAVDAVVRGMQFVSARLTGQIFPTVGNTQAFDRIRIKEMLASFASRLPRNPSAARCHDVQFYSDDAFLLDQLNSFAGAALRADCVVVAFATEPNRDKFVDGLQAYGLDIRSAMKEGSYLLQDAIETISSFMVQDSVDPIRYLEVMANLIESAMGAARSEQCRIAVCGELAVPLLAQGNADAAIQIEQLSDEFASAYALDFLCTYPLNSFPGKDEDHVRQRICAEHAAVLYQ
jgi:CheY-like chemotaxis protein